LTFAGLLTLSTLNLTWFGPRVLPLAPRGASVENGEETMHDVFVGLAFIAMLILPVVIASASGRDAAEEEV